MHNGPTYDVLEEKWNPVLETSALPELDSHKKRVTAQLLENTENALREQALNETPANAMGGNFDDAQVGVAGNLAGYDPVLISLVRRAMPNLMAYDIAGVQPMSAPTGLIFAMKARYDGQEGKEALFQEAQTAYSGSETEGQAPGPHTHGPSGFYELTDSDRPLRVNPPKDSNFGVGMSTEEAEMLGNGSNDAKEWGEMGFTIEKATVTAKSRALKAEYTIELAQDLKAIHGLDAESELANILSAEILAEINREVIRTINSQAKLGCKQFGMQNEGIFDLAADADGRWSVEKFKGLLVQLDRECNQIAKETRRGKGNLVICSSDVATALVASGMLDYAPALSTNLQVDDTGNTFAGVLNGRIKVYIDPYAAGDYVTVGFRGSNPYDAGLFYCPYVPLQMVRAVGERDFQPRIGFKTRYGMASNPFVGPTPADGLAAARSNQYYRIFRVDNILQTTP